jgi:hypothetical protein
VAPLQVPAELTALYVMARGGEGDRVWRAILDTDNVFSGEAVPGVTPVPVSFGSLREYQDAYTLLLREELREHIRQAIERTNMAPIPIHEVRRDHEGAFSRVTIVVERRAQIAPGTPVPSPQLRKNDLIILSRNPRCVEERSSDHILALVEAGRNKSRLEVVTLRKPVSGADCPSWSGWLAGNVITMLRELRALWNLSHRVHPLLLRTLLPPQTAGAAGVQAGAGAAAAVEGGATTVAGAAVPPLPTGAGVLVSPRYGEHLRRNFNASQLGAVLHASYSATSTSLAAERAVTRGGAATTEDAGGVTPCAVTLVQGPPG